MLSALVFALLPSWLGVPFRRLAGQKIGKKAKIGWGTLLLVDDLEMGDFSAVGPFAAVRAKRLKLGKEAKIRPLALLNTHTIELGQYVHIAPTAVVSGSQLPKSKFIVGDHSRIFPFCWLEPGEGIFLGKHVGIGGHNLIFTHGSWSDYLQGGPIGFGPVTIEDHVWLPWRISILTNVTIGANSIVMSGSTVTRSIPPGSIAGGSPAKVIKEGGGPLGLPTEKKLERALGILHSYSEHLAHEGHTPSLVGTCLSFGKTRIQIDSMENLGSGDVLFHVDPDTAMNRNAAELKGVSIVDHPAGVVYLNGDGKAARDFGHYVRIFGIRLYFATKESELPAPVAATTPALQQLES